MENLVEYLLVVIANYYFFKYRKTTGRFVPFINMVQGVMLAVLGIMGLYNQNCREEFVFLSALFFVSDLMTRTIVFSIEKFVKTFAKKPRRNEWSGEDATI